MRPRVDKLFSSYDQFSGLISAILQPSGMKFSTKISPLLNLESNLYKKISLSGVDGMVFWSNILYFNKICVFYKFVFIYELFSHSFDGK